MYGTELAKEAGKMKEKERDMDVELKNTLDVLREGGIIVYPTDTIWGLGCDATDEESVRRIYEIKRRSESKSLVILVSDWDMLLRHVSEVPDGVREFLSIQERPTTVIYKHPRGLASNAVAADDSVAIRIAKDEFCWKLLTEFGKPVVSTSANYSNSPSPAGYSDIEAGLLTQADYIVNLSRDKKQGLASQIVRFDISGQVQFLRK